MNTLAVICARRNERFNKNIALLNGKPMIYYAIKAAQDAKLITRAVVSTNDIETMDIANSYGADVPFLRPSHLATPTSRIEHSLVHALNFCEKQDKIQYECIVLLQNSSPLRLPEDIDSCIQKVKDGHSACMTIHEVIENHPDLCGYLLEDRIRLFRDIAPFRRQDREKVYAINGVVFAIRKQLLLTSGRVIHNNAGYHIIPYYRAIDIHNEIDIEIASAIMNFLEKNNV